MGRAPVDTAHPLEVGAIALVTFVTLITAARLFKWTLYFVSERLNIYIPTRVSYVIGTLVAALLFWSAADGIIFRYGLRLADSSVRRFDALKFPDTRQPVAPEKTGSTASLVRWSDLGRISTGPTRGEISSFRQTDTRTNPSLCRPAIGRDAAAAR